MEGQGIGWRAELERAGKVVVFGRDVGGGMLCDKDIDLEGPQKVFYHSTGLSVQGARGGWIHVLVVECVPTIVGVFESRVINNPVRASEKQ